MIALIAAGFAIQSTQRLRGEEAAGLAEPVLATATSRRRWATAHLALALGGSAVVLAAAGLGTGLASAAISGELTQVPRMLGASLVYAPALWALVGLGAAAFGVSPQATPVAWTALAGCLAVGLLDGLLDLPTWLASVSPFGHIPQLPAAELTILPPLIVTVIAAAALTIVGLLALERRDVGNA